MVITFCKQSVGSIKLYIRHSDTIDGVIIIHSTEKGRMINLPKLQLVLLNLTAF